MNDATLRAKELALKILPPGRYVPGVLTLRARITEAVEPLFAELEITDRGKRKLMNELSNMRSATTQ